MRTSSALFRATLASGLVLVVALWGYAAAAQSCPGKPETSKIVLMADWIPVTVTQGAFWEAKLQGYYDDEGSTSRSSLRPTPPIRSSSSPLSGSPSA